MNKPVVLCILDGWGLGEASEFNAIHRANTPNWDKLVADYGYGEIMTSGESVGLPHGQMGNSEVGHMTIGSGRILYQDLPRIDLAIKDGSLAQHPALLKVKGTCHLLGLLSDGGVHAHINHIKAIAKILEARGVKVLVHAFLDGRDVSQKSALKYLQDSGLHIATVSGRYYAMDRDKRWDRVEKAYDAIVRGNAPWAETAEDAVNKSYEAGITDEFILPCKIGDYQGMNAGDSFIMANFRADRARQILDALVNDNFSSFVRDKTIHFENKIGIVEYSDDLTEKLITLFPQTIPENTMPEIVANAELKQLRIAETEKYAHVTFFMSGGREKLYAGEERVLVQSPNVATYDLQPEMSSVELSDKIVSAISGGNFELVISNFANPDMVGHTGDINAAIKAVESVDVALGKIVAAVDAAGGVLLITADHGNVEEMRDDHDNPHTQHSTNPVPLVVASKKLGKVAVKNGGLADIAPTVLKLLELKQPSEMTGQSLI